MTTPSVLRGLWLPLITPFKDGAVDGASVKRLIRHYLSLPVDGLILAATTGEGMTLEEEEIRRLVDIARDEVARDPTGGARLPLFVGLSGSDTAKGVKALRRTADWPVDGYLITCPYYSRPSQQGLELHFGALAEVTDRPIAIYNIPYRTGVNMANDTLLELARRDTIVGVKDCSADAGQSFDLIRRRPAGFSVMTGEDAFYYTALTLGADGGILASAHVETATFARVRDRLAANDLPAALEAWREIADLTRLLFAEPNPAPVKHWLWREGLIDSPELRLPMTPVTAGLAARIDQEIDRRRRASSRH
ncbi:MAG: 4-hydroxy-tetrahydrodipicolinate synthase [Telmatospirillum sp.]|nr:4-hydroxy-tetrahydrodipicolinate synthase [Telmatospirillum sp.]